ncbi:hypothetical protein SLEP1_g17602 [Rubroshorea leprosula]|uniref:Bet v I/Major latex protein domain-containing protein n=1 Tax=Rubroshorea leprosula TaxID=152421 RepID=A0AAV5J421_9ROSI|nr:hypothetical protein SLEP1_g17602 [Rubroshorea leprosula]
MVSGQLSHELEINAAASKAWELYSTLELAKLAERELKEVLDKTEIVEGDGGQGTVLKLTFKPGVLGFSSYNEKFTKIDHENRVKEAEVVEGGYLELGFTLYRVRFEIVEKAEESCIVKSTIEYELKEEAAANASFVSIQALANLAENAKNYLTQNKA